MTLAFSRSLYRLEAVEQVVSAFQALGELTVRDEGGDILVEVGELHPKLGTRVLDELKNHVLVRTIELERQ